MAVTPGSSPYSLTGGANWNSLYAQPAAPAGVAPSASPAMSGGAGFRTMGGSTASSVLGAPYTPPQVPNELYGRLRDVLKNPGNIEGDPAYQFIVNQGNQALSRSAGARRMRFAGKTMHEFQDFGQKAAGQYWQQLAQTLGQGADTELERWKAEMARAEKEAEQRNLFMRTPEYRLGRSETFQDAPRGEVPMSGFGGSTGIRPSSTVNEMDWRRARDAYTQFFPR